ncbi:radical SAM protein [uncultured Brachyspira sp.]|uniref:radical SAM protein n=1 Tax=uncultured Brachyspira sp. TaxID=221953 RepID=UPI0025D203DA|nr:radical SAM protein [uncultured Brachyspira sp.]
MLLRSKTKELLQTRELTKKQIDNTILNKQEMDNKKTILKSYPQRLVLELTNACNLKCIMCGRDEAEFNPTVFKLDYLKKMEHLLYTIEEVTLFGWGEPTMHPNFIDILKYLNDFPVRKYFVTNGMRLDKIKNALFDYRVDIMAISLDGAKAETNDRIRYGGNFDIIIKNIRDIVKEKKERNLNYPYMNFVMALMDSNIEELPKLIELAFDIGLEEVKGVYLTVFTDSLLNETLYNKQDKVIKIFDEALELANKLNIKLKLPFIQGYDIAEDKYHKDCFVAWRDFFLASDGYVRPCQSTALKFLNFENYDNFEDMWNSKEFQEFRKNVNDQNNMCDECKRCFQSSHANWNNELSFIQINQQFAPEWEK